MKRRSRLSVSTSTSSSPHRNGGGAASADAAGPRASPSSSSSAHHHRAPSPSHISNLLQDLEHPPYYYSQPPSASPPPPPAPIRVRTLASPSPAASPAPSPLGSPEPSPRTAALQLLGEPVPSPDNGGGRRLLFLPKKHSKKVSCAGRVEENGSMEPLLKPQMRDRLASQPLLPAAYDGADHDSVGGFNSVPGSGAASLAGSRSISRASSSSFLGPPHAAGPTSASPTAGSAYSFPLDDTHHHHRHQQQQHQGEAGAKGVEQSSKALADFALAEPTPRVPGQEQLEDPLMLMMAPARETPVRYGAVIRLWVSEEGVQQPQPQPQPQPQQHVAGSTSGGGTTSAASSGSGGFLGFAARDVRRIQGQLPQSGRFNVGMGDTFFVLPPYKPGMGWHFRETYFRVEDPRGAHRDGETVRYGEELLLVDEEDHVMCHFRGRRYIRRKPKGTKGEMTVAFLPGPGREARLGHEIFYGDTGIRVRLQTRKGLRTEGAVLSALKRESIDAVGGFLNCLGRGRELVFDIEHAPPRIHDVSVTATMAHGERVYVNRTVHHRVHWGQQLVFAAPSCQGHTTVEHEGCTIRVSLSNGARLKMHQEHLGGLMDRVRYQQHRGREVWLPTKGIPGEDVDLLVRLVPLDTVPLDPHRLFVANEPRALSSSQGAAGGNAQGEHGRGGRSGGDGGGWGWLLDAPLLLLEGLCELLPPGPVAVFVVASLALGRQGQGQGQGRDGEEAQALGRTLLLLLASAAAYLGVLHLLQGLLALLRWLLPSRVARVLLGHPAARATTLTARCSLSGSTSGSTSSSTSGSGSGSATEQHQHQHQRHRHHQLPESMLFDRWELSVLDWRVPPDAADGDALADSYGHGAQPPPYVPPPVPPTFLEAEKGDADKARARWERTQAWRRENGVDGALQRVHPKFRLFKRLYPQAFHFRDRQGHVVYYELLGRLDVQGLLRAGVTLADLTEHIILQQEFLWRVLQPREEDRVLLVMDLKGVSFADVTAEVINFAKAAVGLTSTHYPARSFRTLIVNTPSWFSVVFRIIRPMLNEDTRRKIVFLEEAALRDGAMLDYIAPEFLPKEYGGACEVPLGESPFEKQLLEIVDAAVLKEAEADKEKEKEKEKGNAEPRQQQQPAGREEEEEDEEGEDDD